VLLAPRRTRFGRARRGAAVRKQATSTSDPLDLQQQQESSLPSTAQPQIRHPGLIVQNPADPSFQPCRPSLPPFGPPSSNLVQISPPPPLNRPSTASKMSIIQSHTTASLSDNWRSINIDALDPESSQNFDLSTLYPGLPDVSEPEVRAIAGQVRQLLRGGDSEGALRGACETAPVGATSESVKVCVHSPFGNYVG
jgi:hypothetical protein